MGGNKVENSQKSNDESYVNSILVILGRVILNPFQYLFSTVIFVFSFVKFILLALGAIFTIVIISIGFLVNKTINPDIASIISENTILEIKLDAPMVDGPAHLAIGGNVIRKPVIPLRAMIESIDKAAIDPRIKGIVIHTETIEGDLVSVTELRNSLDRFKKSGKTVISYSSSFNTLKEYYLASVANKIFLHHVGHVKIKGLSMDIPFIRTALDNAGINVNIIKKEEYKSSFDPLSRDNMSKADRESKQAILDAMLSHVTNPISSTRGIAPQLFDDLMGKVIIDDLDAIQYGLVDKLIYGDELELNVKTVVYVNDIINSEYDADDESVGGAEIEQDIEGIDIATGAKGIGNNSGNDSEILHKYKIMKFTDYMNDDIFETLKKTLYDGINTVKKVGGSIIPINSDYDNKNAVKYKNKTKSRSKPKRAKENIRVAIIYASGVISDSNLGVFAGGKGYIRSKDIEEQFKQARESQVDAIVLRIDSGGGDPVTSEKIARQIELARKDNIMVYAFMGAAAASGGYWCSVAADKIVAHPITITGSIGVLSAIPTLSKLWKKLQVNWEKVTTTENSDMFSPHHQIKKEHMKIINDMISRSYDRFIKKVAQHRNLEVDYVKTIAKGRVWTGSMAQQNGLVDVVGGYDKLFKEIIADFGIKGVDNMEIIEYPGPKGFFADLRSGLPLLTSLVSGIYDFACEIWSMNKNNSVHVLAQIL